MFCVMFGAIYLFILIEMVPSQISVTENKYDPVTNMIESHGYPVESHFVRTKDHYMLKMHRIPYGLPMKIFSPPKGVSIMARLTETINTKLSNKPLPVVLIMHGIFGSSADFIVPGPDKGLGYILADAGYDVWMGNARGNTYSRKHVYLEPESPAFWSFSWHEIGMLDLPAMISYILKKTNQPSLHYVGYSQGVTSVMVMLSENVELQEKIKSINAMAPAIYFARSKNRLLKRLSSYTAQYKFFVHSMEMYETFPQTELTRAVGTVLCNDDFFITGICEKTLFTLVGADSQQLDKDLLPRITEFFPAGSSWKQLVHYAQLVESKKFQMYDFKKQTSNINMYGKQTPPKYKISKINTPVVIYYGTNDNFISVLDVEDLAKDLPNVISTNELIGWNHMDFLFGRDANIEVYNKIIETIRSSEFGVITPLVVDEAEADEDLEESEDY